LGKFSAQLENSLKRSRRFLKLHAGIRKAKKKEGDQHRAWFEEGKREGERREEVELKLLQDELVDGREVLPGQSLLAQENLEVSEGPKQAREVWALHGTEGSWEKLGEGPVVHRPQLLEVAEPLGEQPGQGGVGGSLGNPGSDRGM
jgi:hypothetical protein